jgi:hypothetical protein
VAKTPASGARRAEGASAVAVAGQPAELPDASPTSDPRDFPIVGIGASAGGLAAFEAFFSAIPTDTHMGMAFVLVQHLAPDHSSILTELVGRYTQMEVRQVEDGMVVQADAVYIIPPNRDMALLNGTLQLMEPSAPHGLRLPIDFFFRSLAQDRGRPVRGLDRHRRGGGPFGRGRVRAAAVGPKDACPIGLHGALRGDAGRRAAPRRGAGRRRRSADHRRHPPKMNGWDLAQRVRLFLPGVAVMFMSGSTRPTSLPGRVSSKRASCFSRSRSPRSSWRSGSALRWADPFPPRPAGRPHAAARGWRHRRPTDPR